jgi:hypothetical protein
MIERSSDPIEVRCKDCGAVTQITSAQMTGRPDDRCQQGHPKNVLWCPSMHAAVSEAIAKRVGQDRSVSTTNTSARERTIP